MATPHVPELDEQLRRRLGRRFGAAVESWLDDLQPVLADLAGRWQIDFESLIQRGSVSVVIRCRTGDGRRAVLKVSPERGRIVDEAAALARWRTVHVPAVLAVDEGVGALLIEAVAPGTTLAESRAYPSLESLGALITSLHAEVDPDPSYRPVAERIAYLYESGLKNYQRRPDLAALISPDLYERGRELALRLAAEAPATVLLHGDLTPGNVLDGGEARGLVAIDPAPCLGDPAFDAIDLVLWRAEDVETRAKQLAPLIGVDAARLFRWCAAFAAMTALETAEASDKSPERVDFLVAFARAQS
ncbi:MAG: aminoglycoside phosphotransferase family protein [Nocardioidaceae bacterium]